MLPQIAQKSGTEFDGVLGGRGAGKPLGRIGKNRRCWQRDAGICEINVIERKRKLARQHKECEPNNSATVRSEPERRSRP